MKKKRSAIWKTAAILLLSAIVVGIPLAGCKQTGKPSDTGTTAPPADETIALVKDGKAVYTVVRGDNCTENEKNAAVYLRNRFEEITGLEMEITTDWDDGEDYSNRYEILIGRTTRTETKKAIEGLGELDFTIQVTGTKIVIGTSTEYAIDKAVKAFCAAYLDGKTAETATVPMNLNYIYKRDENVSANYLDSSKIYAPKVISVLTNSAELDKEYLFKNTAAALSDLRFADGTAEIIYKFDISNMTEPKFTFSMLHAYVVEVAEIPGRYTKVIENESGAETVNVEIKPYDYKIYDTLFVRLTDPTPEDGGGAAISSFTMTYYEEGNADNNPYFLNADMKNIVTQLSAATKKSAVNGYAIHDDGGMIYDAVSRDKADSLNKYDNAATYTGTVSLGDATLTYSIPKNVTAYDCVPVNYTLFSKNAVTTTSPLHISVTGQEDKNRENGNLYYDLNLPGKVDITYTYEGYVSGYTTANTKPDLTLNFSGDKQASSYPAIKTGDLIQSGTIKSSEYVWFKFTYTNTGDTVLDGDGNGTFCFEPLLYKKNGSSYQQVSSVSNLYYRITDELYPSESGTLWVVFPYENMPAGEYYVKLNGLVRNEMDHPENFGRTIWGGEAMTSSSFYFKVSGQAETTVPQEIKKTTASSVKRNQWLHTYQEFQSSYESWLKMSAGETVTGTIYVQLSPWTNQVVLKLIHGNDMQMQAVSIPVSVESDSLSVTFNPDNKNYVVLENGTRFPAIMTQSMADMRVNITQSPDPAADIVKYLAEIKDLGINVVNTTAGFAYDNGNGGNAFWFASDVMRKLGLKLEGFVSYPYVNMSNIAMANQISGGSLQAGGNGSTSLGVANGIMAKYQFLRWGDNYWIADGHTILSVEHTRGGTGITTNTENSFDLRDSMDSESKANFIIFCQSLYGTIDALNSAWGSDYKTFYEIDPAADAEIRKGTFGSWKRALADLDAYRTMERAYSYKTMLSEVSSVLPNAMVDLRTEGSHWMATVAADSDNMHYRHVYYDQRGNAIIPEILGASGTVYCISSYIWDAYRANEVAYLTKSSVENGVIPANLPLFNRMRDVAINSKYGKDYTYQYNLSGKDRLGVEINTTVSLYEWWKATYENGGVPGILWSDWLCDGYATETQRREIQFFVGKLTEALSSGEGKKWTTDFKYDDSVLDASNGVYTYDPAFVQSVIDAYYAQK